MLTDIRALTNQFLIAFPNINKPYVGDQDQAFKDQQAQESFDQGKYNLGSSLLPIHL